MSYERVVIDRMMLRLICFCWWVAGLLIGVGATVFLITLSREGVLK